MTDDTPQSPQPSEAQKAWTAAGSKDIASPPVHVSHSVAVTTPVGGSFVDGLCAPSDSRIK